MSAELRKKILADAEACVCKDRNASYGPPEDGFKRLAALWSAYLSGPIPITIRECDVAIMLALLKVTRLAHNPDHRDSWVDLAGYAACGGGMVEQAPKQDPEECDAVCDCGGKHKCKLPNGHEGLHQFPV